MVRRLLTYHSRVQGVDLTFAEAYRLYTVVPRLLLTIDNLTNWYIRFNRLRLKGSAGLGLEDTTSALNTLLEVLFTIIRCLAPFTPFVTEHIYGLLKPYLDLSQFEDSRSLHFIPFPTVQEALFDEGVERQLSSMQKVIQLGRTSRDRCNVPLKTPLLSLVVIADAQVTADIESLKTYILQELNVREIVATSDESQFNILLEARVDWPTLGKKLKKDVKLVRDALPKLSQEDLRKYVAEKKITVGGIELVENDLSIVRVLGQMSDGESKWEPSFENDMIVLLDRTVDPELTEEGLVREILSRIQRLRKKAGLTPTDDVGMEYKVLENPEEVDVKGLVEGKRSLFVQACREALEPVREGEGGDKELIMEEEQVIGNLGLLLRLVKL